MRGRDEETGEFLGPSRSQKRREALDVLELAKALVALAPTQLSRVPVPEATLPHIEEARRITSNIAHKRQLAFLAKQMRKLDDAELQAMRDALDEKSEASRAQAAARHRVEAWRARLVDEGDVALNALLESHPEIDRQRVRQLVRKAQDEKNRGKPPRAFRELFRELRDAILGGSADDATLDDLDSSDG